MLSLYLCCSGYNHTPKFFLTFILEPPYQPFIASCIVLSSTQASVIFFHNDSLSIKICCIPLTRCFIGLGPAAGWAAPSINCTILEGNQPSLQKLCNYVGKPTGLQNYANLYVTIHWANCVIPRRAGQPKNYAILGSSELIYLEIVQFL